MLNTMHKIWLARILSKMLIHLQRFCFLSKKKIVTRARIKWSLDLEEGIDLSIYLFGGFELSTLACYKKFVVPGNIVLDIGANIGAHTLPLAQLVGDQGKVIAFEPTQYAFQKLKNNIQLNPSLIHRINIEQIMLVRQECSQLPPALYSSWPLHTLNDVHQKHGGRLMSTNGCRITTLDHYVQSLRIPNIHLIKLDVDGNEYDILMSGQMTLQRYKPMLIMELAPYIYEDDPSKFDNALRLLWDLGYKMMNVKNGKMLPQDPRLIRSLIPLKGSINTLISCVI